MRTDDKASELARLPLHRAILTTLLHADVDVQAAQIAFNAVFSIGPLMALTMTLLSALPDRDLRSAFRRLILPYAPDAVRPMLEAQLDFAVRAPNTWLVLLSLLGLLWTISAATAAISVGLRHVGWQLLPSWVRQRLRSALLGVVASLGLALSAIAATVGPVILRGLSRLTHVPFDHLASLAWIRFPLAGVAFGLAASLFVGFGTAQRPRLLAVAWGGATAGVVSVLASGLLSLYLSRAPRLGGAYAAAGAVFATLLWLYVLALGLLVGAVVAFVIDRRGPRLRPLIVGTTHLATHYVHPAESARPRGRLLRRHGPSIGSVVRGGRLARGQRFRGLQPSPAKGNGGRHVALGAQRRQVEPQHGDGARDGRRDAREDHLTAEQPGGGQRP